MTKTFKYSLIGVSSENDIPTKILNTPLADLIKYHNLSKAFKDYEKAELIIVMCMDNRKQLNLPKKFTYILRTAGARITGSEFKLSFAIGFADIKHVALICHSECGMVNLRTKREKVVKGLIENAGWSEDEAKNHFDSFAPFFEIENEIDFVINESKRLNEKYPKVQFQPFMYEVKDDKLYFIKSN